MEFIIDKKIFEKFLGLNIGVVIAKGINNSGASEEIQAGLRGLKKEIREKCNTETLSLNPKIDVWRKAYSAFGAKPKENKSSVESLRRTVLQGNPLRHINKLVDIYNFISLKHMLPAGGEDIDKMKGNILLTFAGKKRRRFCFWAIMIYGLRTRAKSFTRMTFPQSAGDGTGGKQTGQILAKEQKTAFL